MPSKNVFLIAAAGSGKTEFLIDEALKINGESCLITTFTRANEEEIRSRFIRKVGYVPNNVKIQTWFSLILQHGVRPYQGRLYDSKIKGMILVNEQSVRYSKASDVKTHFLNPSGKLYSDKMAKFALTCDEQSNGSVQKRIAKIFRHIFVDEVQDIGGYDLEFLKLLLESNAKNILVGDIRQSTYTTNPSAKNGKYKGTEFPKYFKDKKIDIDIQENTLDTNFRSHPKICELANKLFPKLPSAKSSPKEDTGHDGVFLVKKTDVQRYLEQHCPMQLRDSKATSVIEGYNTMNFGESKGQTFPRVLIYPTKPIEKWLKNPTADLAETTRSKLYVAITRAQHSTAFVINSDASGFNGLETFT